MATGNPIEEFRAGRIYLSDNVGAVIHQEQSRYFGEIDIKSFSATDRTYVQLMQAELDCSVRGAHLEGMLGESAIAGIGIVLPWLDKPDPMEDALVYHLINNALREDDIEFVPFAHAAMSFLRSFERDTQAALHTQGQFAEGVMQPFLARYGR